MWRRETRLAYWLSRDNKQETPESACGFIEKILGKIGPAALPCPIHSTSLSILSKTINLNEELVARAEVHDGLTQIDPVLDSPQSDRARSITNTFKCGIYSVGLSYPQNAVRDFPLTWGSRLKVHSGTLKVTLTLHNIALHERANHVRNIECLPAGTSPVNNGNQWIIKEAQVKSNLSELSALSFKRMSLDIGRLDDSECQGFLKEAEALRHIPVERSELLAVFRSVPIEIISRLQYLSDKRMIIFGISSQLRRTQTRLHDMAAIRDLADQEIHLVPHRAQYKTVALTE
jgi:hypothetical protein